MAFSRPFHDNAQGVKDGTGFHYVVLVDPELTM